MAHEKLPRNIGSDTSVTRQLNRPCCEKIDDLLGRVIPVLADGFIRVIDYMGNDAAVVQAARVSYGAGTKRVSEDRGLIRFLMRHRHTTPFEMCELKLHIRVPMDVWRQWIRHRTANVNEYSTRYSVAIDANHRTAPTDWRLQDSGNKQGSSGTLPLQTGLQFTQLEQELLAHSESVYKARLAAGIAREQARKDLPLSTFTEAYWKIDLHNLLHFLELRLAAEAQLEIRSYAQVIGEQIVAKWVPLVWEAFLDYRAGAVAWSRIELGVLGALVANNPSVALEIATQNGWLAKNSDGHLLRNREREELERKLGGLKLEYPWP